ncbi:MAG TPA: c-type cytochrome [Burkholderiales bacterium]|nr:c-type cytochrome [Burkholderiales bacterium]
MRGDRGLFKLDNPWRWKGWIFLFLLTIVPLALGIFVLPRYQQNGPQLGLWGALCRGLGLTADNGPANEPQPPLHIPTRIAWTRSTLDQIGAGSAERGASIALQCAACHGAEGVSASGLIPTLAGMDAVVIYKQLEDFRSGKRQVLVMNTVATFLTDQDMADVAVYFMNRSNGLPAVGGERIPQGGRSLRESDLAIRLVFAGDPGRGIPACAACHGPGGHKLGAPALESQQPAYIEHQLAAFAQGIRRNDINEQMRTVAKQLTPVEMHVVAALYGSAGTVRAER